MAAGELLLLPTFTNPRKNSTLIAVRLYNDPKTFYQHNCILL